MVHWSLGLPHQGDYTKVRFTYAKLAKTGEQVWCQSTSPYLPWTDMDLTSN